MPYLYFRASKKQVFIIVKYTSVGIATGYGLDGRGRIFLFPIGLHGMVLN
jgi:hypothetical protein